MKQANTVQEPSARRRGNCGSVKGLACAAQIAAGTSSFAALGLRLLKLPAQLVLRDRAEALRLVRAALGV